MHRAKSLALLAGLALLFAVVGFQLFGATAALVILAGVLAVNWLAVGRARVVILWAHRARPLRPSGAALLQAGIMRARERLADEDASRLTGDPRGLASALLRIDQYSRYLTGWLRRFRFICTSEGDDGSRWLRTHPSTGERVRVLLEMEEATQVVGRVPVQPVRSYRLVS